MYDDYENDDGEFEAMVRFRRQEQAYIDEDNQTSMEDLITELKSLLSSDYVGVETDTQLKLGVSTLKNIVCKLQRLDYIERWYGDRYDERNQ